MVTSYVNNSTLEIVTTFSLEKSKILSTCRILNESLYFFVYQEYVEVFCFEPRKSSREVITKFSFDGAQIQAAHMRESLVALATSNSYLVLIFFKLHKHFLVTAKLEEGVTVKILEVMGNNNYVFLHDSRGQSYLISIKEDYAKRPSFDFSISTKEDFFQVQRIKAFSKDGHQAKIVRVIEGMGENPSFLMRYLSDVEGNLHALRLPPNTPPTVDQENVQNYLRSHNFEYRAMFLSSSVSPSLEKLLRSPIGKIEATSFDFTESQSIYQCFMSTPAFKREEAAVISVWAQPEPIIKQISVPTFVKKQQPPSVNLNLNTFQDQLNANQSDQEDNHTTLEPEGMPETESNLNINSKAASLLQKIGRSAGLPKSTHKLITREMHNLVRTVEKLSCSFKEGPNVRLMAGLRNPLRDGKKTSDLKEIQRSKAPTRGATQRGNNNSNEVSVWQQRSASVQNKSRPASKNKSFRITNKSTVV